MNNGKNDANNNAKNDAKNKRLKVFRLNAAILSLQFVNLVMFYCSLLSKTCLDVYRPTPQYCLSQALVAIN